MRVRTVSKDRCCTWRVLPDLNGRTLDGAIVGPGTGVGRPLGAARGDGGRGGGVPAAGGFRALDTREDLCLGAPVVSTLSPARRGGGRPAAGGGARRRAGTFAGRLALDEGEGAQRDCALAGVGPRPGARAADSVGLLRRHLGGAEPCARSRGGGERRGPARDGALVRGVAAAANGPFRVYRRAFPRHERRGEFRPVVQRRKHRRGPPAEAHGASHRRGDAPAENAGLRGIGDQVSGSRGRHKSLRKGA